MKIIDLAIANLFIIFAIIEVSPTPQECHRDIEVLWSTKASSSSVVSSPLIADVNGDNVKDVLFSSFGGEVVVVDGGTGHFLPGWPVNFPDKTFHAAPLLFDIDNDGMREVVVCSSDGQIIFIRSNGSLMEGEMLQVPPLVMKVGWYRISYDQVVDQHNPPTSPTVKSSTYLSSPEDFIQDSLPDEIQSSQRGSDYNTLWSKYQPGRRPSGLLADGKWVYVDPQILSTPLIADFSGSGNDDELIVVVNFYFSKERPAFPGLSVNEMKDFVASGILVFSLQTKQIVFNVTLEISQQLSQYPAYSLALPTHVSEFGVLIGTAKGNIFLIRKESAGNLSPIHVMDSIHGQVSIADVDNDGKLELLAVDRSGNVVCKELLGDGTGSLVWETTLSMSSPAGVRLADVDGDQQLEVVIATTDGYVWVIEAKSGKLQPEWPVKVSSSLRAIPLITQLEFHSNSVLDLIVPTLSGEISVIRGNDACSDVIQINKPMPVAAVAADLATQSAGLEFIVATDDGTLICMGHKNSSAAPEKRKPSQPKNLLSWSAETLPCSGTTFFSGKIGVRFIGSSLQDLEVIGRQFPLTFEIVDRRPRVQQGKIIYQVKIFIGQRLVEKTKIYNQPGVYTEVIPCPDKPIRAAVTIKLVLRPNVCFEDTRYMSFNQNFHRNLPWLLITPSLVMWCVLLAVHGFRPLQKHILPT